MKITKAMIENFLSPLAEEDANIKISLFVISLKNQRFKKLNLENLTLEERTAKLRKWSQERRYVAVIETGDMVFAHTHAKHAEKLSQSDLSLNGKKVTIKALTDEESDQLALIGEAFEECMHSHKVEEEKKEKEDHDRSFMQHPYFAGSELICDQMHMHHLIGQMMKNNLSQIITKSLQQFSEARRELQKQKEADEKYFDIKKTEIKKDILRSEIKAEEIKRQNLKQRILFG